MATVNPYAAPTQTTRFVGLSPDTEFIVSGECVLCEAKVSLPPVCISTGKTNGLTQVAGVLKWSPRWVTNLRVLLTVFGTPFLIGSSIQFMNEKIEDTATVLHALCALAVFVATTAVWVHFAIGRRRVEAKWFIEQRLEKKESSRRRFWKNVSGVGALAAVGAVLMGAAGLDRGLFVAAVWLLLLSMLVWVARVGKPTSPTFIGRHEGLNVLLMKPSFIDEVRRIMEQQSA